MLLLDDSGARPSPPSTHSITVDCAGPSPRGTHTTYSPATSRTLTGELDDLALSGTTISYTIRSTNAELKIRLAHRSEGTREYLEGEGQSVNVRGQNFTSKITLERDQYGR